MKKIYLIIAYLLTLVAYVVAQENTTDLNIGIGDTLTLSVGTDYTMDGYVYVEDGAVLIIEAGVVVKCKSTPTTGDLSTALIISRGGKIFAEGTKDAPIIFTSDEDDLSITTDLSPFDFQKWGGIVILGKGVVGEDGGTDNIEGIPEGDGRSEYGGTDNADNSGILKYVSIRHGGAVLEQDNEINGLTLGGVGSGTEIDYIEVFSGKDDGIEIFGGAVNITHAAVAFIGDDSYDFDESWTGSMQYIFSLQQNLDSEFGGDHAIEYDGSESEDKEPKTVGRIYNGTFIGAGPGSANGESDGIVLKSDGAAQIWNSLILSSGGYAVAVESTSLDRLAAGESAFANNIIFDYTTLALNDDATVLAALAVGNTENVDPMLGGISRIPDGGLDPRPSAESPALSGAAVDPNAADFIETTNYRGAFDNETNWALGWTALDSYGFFGDLATVGVFDVTENGMEIQTSPNPVYTGTSRVTFNLPHSSEVQVMIHDITGKTIERWNSGYFYEGANSLILNTSRLEQGTYILSLISASGIATQKFIASPF
ncbi:MAG: T9SS type A sorting domain-containing protein [Saprospiraceae bacterium]|nr:T9SS type A sorting domain-containing protein [Saprospiraceae bacterium]